MSGELSSRLSRWSQRKLASRHGGALPEPADAAEKTHPGDDMPAAAAERQNLQSDGLSAPDPRPDLPPAETGGEAAVAEGDQVPDLPPVDTLTAQSDYTAFLQKNVPEALKRAALRKLWLSDPVLANLDGLNDYDDDYSIVETVMSSVQSAYKPGRGYPDETEATSAPDREPGAEPELAKTDETLSARAEQDDSQDSAEDSAEDGDEDGTAAGSGDGNNDAPAAASPEQTRPVGRSEQDKA